MHGDGPAIFGFPAPWPPRAGGPRPSLLVIHSFIPWHGKFFGSTWLFWRSQARPRIGLGACRHAGLAAAAVLHLQPLAGTPEGFVPVRLTVQTHDLAQMLFGFPAPRPPCAGEPRPSLFLGCTFFLRNGLLWTPLVPTEVPGTAGQVLGACQRRIARAHSGQRSVAGELGRSAPGSL